MQESIFRDIQNQESVCQDNKGQKITFQNTRCPKNTFYDIREPENNFQIKESFYRRYISSFSHEIRNPLTLIYSSLQIIEKECPGVMALPLWTQTRKDLQYTLRLLEDASSLNREYQLAFTTFPAQDFLSELALSVETLLRKHQIQLDTDIICGTETRMCICADRTRLKEALTNLLINAVDALSVTPVSHERRICLTAEYMPDTASRSTNLPLPYVCLHVKDNGPGIPEEYLETLFDPFITHKTNGTGLGLSIVRDIAARHGGTISVETDTSASGAFTDFRLCIPSENTKPAL